MRYGRAGGAVAFQPSKAWEKAPTPYYGTGLRKRLESAQVFCMDTSSASWQTSAKTAQSQSWAGRMEDVVIVVWCVLHKGIDGLLDDESLPWAAGRLCRRLGFDWMSGRK